MICLKTNKVCTNINKKCKECILDECKKVMSTIEFYEKQQEKLRLNRLKRQLPTECMNCSMLEVINVNKEKVKCFYRIKNKCILEGMKNES